MIIKDLYPEKAQYLTGEPVNIIAELTTEGRVGDTLLVLTVTRLEQTISRTVHSITQKADNNGTITLNAGIYDTPFGGFGVKLALFEDGEEKEARSTAFDMVASPERSVRYGFLSDFSADDKDTADVSTLRKYHINFVQYYDWSYRHDNLVAEQEEYTDMMGKPVSLAAVKNKIAACRSYGMKSLGYGAVYAASKDFYEQHKDWGLYTAAGEPFVFIDVFYIMNVMRACPWHEHIVGQYQRAVQEVGFDGIHMDTYGFPKTAYSHYHHTELLRMERHYPELIQSTKEALNKVKDDNYLIFNNVGNWPVDTVANAPQSAVYIEVWPPYGQYCHIKQLITDAKRACGNAKPVILAAYLAPFRLEDAQSAMNAALLLTAAITTAGGTHLLLGEENAVLTQGYYVDHSILTQAQAALMRRYYDFIIRYMELFYDSALQDVTMTHMGWDNTEYRCLHPNWSACGEADRLWLTIKEKPDLKLISLINLCGSVDALWNKGKAQPETQHDLPFEVQVDLPIDGVFFATPDDEDGSAKALDYTLKKTSYGLSLCFTVPKVRYWSLVYIRLKEEAE